MAAETPRLSELQDLPELPERSRLSECHYKAVYVEFCDFEDAVEILDKTDADCLIGMGSILCNYDEAGRVREILMDNGIVAWL